MSVDQIRETVVAYLAPLGHKFRENPEGRFQGKWNLYVAHISHVPRKPITVITNPSSQIQSSHVDEPPDLLHPDTWERGIVITCAMDKHFDGVSVTLSHGLL